MKLNRFLEWVVIIGIYSILLTPFIVSRNLFFPFITGKAFFFRVIVEIVFATWLILVTRNKSYLPKKSPILWSFLAFTLVMFLADYFGVSRVASFWSNFERMEGFVTIAHLLAYFIVLISVFKTNRVWRNFLKFSVITSVCMTVYSLMQLSGYAEIHQGNVRLDGLLGNATYLAIYVLFNIFFALFLFIKEKNDYWKSFYTISVILNLIVLYFTATRGAILGLIGGVLLSAIIISVFSKDRPKLRKFSIGLILAVVIFVGLFILVKDSPFVRESKVLKRFATISLEDRTTLSRFLIWGIAFDAVKEKPLLGYGQSNFDTLFDTGYDPRLYNQEQWFDRAHNIVMDTLVSGGFLGLITYLSIFIFALYLLWKKSQLSLTEKSVITGLLAAYFFQNLFVFDNLMSYILFVSTLALINFESIGADTEFTENSNNKLNYFLSVVVIAALVGTVYFVNVPLYKSSSDLIKALQSAYNSNTGQFATLYSTPLKNLEFYKNALDLGTAGNPEIRTQLSQSSINILRANNVPDDMKIAFHNYAVLEIEKQIEESPLNARYPFVLGSYYAQIGDFGSAIKYFEKAFELSPKKQIISSALAISYAKSGDVEHGLSLAKDVYDMEKRSREAWFAYITIADLAGRNDIVDVLMSEAIENREYEWAINFTTVKVLGDLGNLDNYIILADLYLQSGKRVEATQVLEEGRKNVPSQASLIDKKITEIMNSPM